jgi:hypothetical protein
LHRGARVCAACLCARPMKPRSTRGLCLWQLVVSLAFILLNERAQLSFALVAHVPCSSFRRTTTSCTRRRSTRRTRSPRMTRLTPTVSSHWRPFTPPLPVAFFVCSTALDSRTSCGVCLCRCRLLCRFRQATGLSFASVWAVRSVHAVGSPVPLQLQLRRRGQGAQSDLWYAVLHGDVAVVRASLVCLLTECHFCFVLCRDPL